MRENQAMRVMMTAHRRGAYVIAVYTRGGIRLAGLMPDRSSSGEILQPLITLMSPYFLDPPAPHGATVGLTELHCEDQEQPDHAYQIANPAHAYAAFGALPKGEREIFHPIGSGASVMVTGPCMSRIPITGLA
jgi:hypothetical protein